VIFEGMKCLVNPLALLHSTTPNPRPSMISRNASIIEEKLVTQR
jgi:hypothetical protein